MDIIPPTNENCNCGLLEVVELYTPTFDGRFSKLTAFRRPGSKIVEVVSVRYGVESPFPPTFPSTQKKKEE